MGQAIMGSAFTNESVQEPGLALKSCPNANRLCIGSSSATGDPGGIVGAVERFFDLHGYSQKELSRVAIKYKRRVFVANLNDVFAIVAQGNYVIFEQASRSCRLRESISNIAEKLKPYGFIRIHRSRIINKLWAEEFRPRSAGEYLVRLRGGQEYIVTKSHKKNLESLADLWFGNNVRL